MNEEAIQRFAQTLPYDVEGVQWQEDGEDAEMTNYVCGMACKPYE